VLKSSNWLVKVLGGVVGVNLTLALAVSAGAVPHPGTQDEVHAAPVDVEDLAAPARQPGDNATPPQVETPAPADALWKALSTVSVRMKVPETRVTARATARAVPNSRTPCDSAPRSSRLMA
jgi:hypothetical protein